MNLVDIRVFESLRQFLKSEQYLDLRKINLLEVNVP